MNYTHGKEKAYTQQVSNEYPVEERAAELFEIHRGQIFKRTDRLFAWLMCVQWLAGIVLACWLSPKTWNGSISQTHLHIWMALFLGGALTVFPVGLALMQPGKALTRHVICIGQMLMSALLIHLTGGRIETHFHVFGSLAIVAFYRDWRVLLSATVIVAGDHFLRGVYAPLSVYGATVADGWRWVEHAGWVIFEDIFLMLSCVQSLREMRGIALRQAQLEASNKVVQDSSEKLRESETRFRSLSDFSPTGIFEVDAQGRGTYANDRCLSILGLTFDECAGDGWTNAVHPEDRDGVVAKWLGAIRTKSDMADEYRILTPGGELRWVVVSARALFLDDGTFSGHVGTLTDITERKHTEDLMRQAKEAAENANEAKSTFLSRMSHELRTPLNSILGFGQLLEMGNPAPRDAESIEHIMKAGKHLLGLINEVLDVARVESGNLSISLEPVPVGAIIDEVVGLVRPLASQGNVNLKPVQLEDTARYVMADRQRLKQALLNILANAVKYNREGGSVTVSCEKSQAGGLRIIVSDTGRGIRPEMLKRMFTPFDRLDAEQSGVEGTGLGLTVSKAFVEAMNGSIWVTSEVGAGSEFTIELPLAVDPMESLEKVSETDIDAAGTGSANPRTVLYIEDNAANLRLIETILERRPGIKLVSTTQGRQGVEMALEHRPDLTLLDLNLPDISGKEVLCKLQENPQTRDIPVIMISADATDGQAKRMTDFGARAYLTKPIEVKQFLEVLDELLLAA